MKKNAPSDRVAEVVALRALDGCGDHEHDEPDDRQGEGDQHEDQRGDAELVAGGRRDRRARQARRRARHGESVVEAQRSGAARGSDAAPLYDSATRGARPNQEDDTGRQEQQRECQARNQQVRAGCGEKRHGAARRPSSRRAWCPGGVMVSPPTSPSSPSVPSSTVLSPTTEMALPPTRHRRVRTRHDLGSAEDAVLTAGEGSRAASGDRRRDIRAARRRVADDRDGVAARGHRGRGISDDLGSARDPVRAIGDRGVTRTRSAARSVGDRRPLGGGVADHPDRVAADDHRNSGIRQHLRATGDAVITGGPPRGAARRIRCCPTRCRTARRTSRRRR